MRQLPPRLKHLARFIPREPSQQSDLVYLISCHDFVKIGIAHDVPARIAALQTGCPYPLVLLAYWRSDDAIQEEETLHAKLDRYRIRGEWFKLPSDLLSQISRKTPGELARDILQQWPIPL